MWLAAIFLGILATILHLPIRETPGPLARAVITKKSSTLKTTFDKIKQLVPVVICMWQGDIWGGLDNKTHAGKRDLQVVNYDTDGNKQ